MNTTARSNKFITAELAKLEASANYQASPPKEREETKLAVTLDISTNPSSPGYDPSFSRKIRRIRPDWFSEEN